MNTTAIWVLDAIVGIGTLAVIAALAIVGRRVSELSRSMSSAILEIRTQVSDLKNETALLMQSTRVSEEEFNRLARQLTRFGASAETAVRILPLTTAGGGGSIAKVANVIMGISAGYRVLHSILARRKS
ncbi:MAG: hypothetical protein Q7V53_07785 [Caldisericota bacterium]|nr:hypothetical protein [Caldisericota bacterium]